MSELRTWHSSAIGQLSSNQARLGQVKPGTAVQGAPTVIFDKSMAMANGDGRLTESEQSTAQAIRLQQLHIPGSFRFKTWRLQQSEKHSGFTMMMLFRNGNSPSFLQRSHLTQPHNGNHHYHRHSRRRWGFIRWFLVGLIVISIQVAVNFVVYLNIYRPEKDPVLIHAVQELQYQLEELQLQHQQQMYEHDGIFHPFTIRDAKRLTPVQVPPEFHIFDYLDPNTGNQRASKASQLWLDAHYLAPAPCHRYLILCYKQKILQVFDYLLKNTTATYFFYMEADNELCVPLQDIRALAYRHERYFIGTGIGFSGWIMNRTFVEDFVKAYRPQHKYNNEYPDPIGARLLMEKKAWTVTRNYLVSHTIKQGLGDPALTVGQKHKDAKHLPRCMEPKRNIWYQHSKDTEDMHGWDYFHAEDCPPDAEIYPCRDDQYVNVTYGVADMIKCSRC